MGRGWEYFMLVEQVEKLADLLMENDQSRNVDKDIIVYGLCTAIEHLACILTTIVLGCLFGLLLESLVFLIAFSSIRTYAGGYHCQNSIHCYFASSGVIAMVLVIVKLIPSNFVPLITTAVLLICVSVLLKCAPVETPSKPLDDAEKRYYRKKTLLHLGITCVICVFLIIVQLYQLAFAICLAILVSAILTIC